MALERIQSQDWDGLLDADELRAARTSGDAFVGFREGDIRFPPTFKVVRQVELEYTRKRTPSYCDRILWKSMPGCDGRLQQTTLSSVEAVSTSDHKPVVAAFDPAKSTPVCTASDAIYRGAQQSIAVIVGPKVFEEYAPLIAGGLLRVRLELCVVESFFGEAVLPFVQKNGLSWVLPFHETVETFLAGTIFALVLNFILVGSTKILQVVVTWFDFFLGMPSRFVSTKAIDQLSDEKDASPKPAVVAFTVSKTAGEAIGLARQFVDALDVFTSQYLSLTTAAYITFKFLHFRVFD